MRDNEIVHANVGLTKLEDKINSLFPQVAIQSQYPKNKVRFLRKAGLEQDWAKTSIAQIVTSKFGFDDLLISLREHYQQEKEVEDAKTKSGSVPSTLYQQYGRNPKSFHRGNASCKPYNGSMSKPYNPLEKRLNPIGKDGQRMRCSLCGSIEHFAKECPPGASRHFVRSKLAKSVPAVHICHDLLNGIEELSQSTTDPGPEDTGPLPPNNLEDDEESPSELHLFEEISNENDEGDQPSLFEALDESIATNFIAARIAEKPSYSPPKMISSPPIQDLDFL